MPGGNFDFGHKHFYTNPILLGLSVYDLCYQQTLKG